MNSGQPLVDLLLEQTEQSLWANLKWIEYVYSQDDGEPWPRELLAHIMFGERIWFERVEGEQTTRTQSSFLVLDKVTLIAEFETNAENYQRLIRGDLNRQVEFTRDEGSTGTARVIDVIQHLITHGYHHRGQLAKYYAARGDSYPNTDYINHLLS